MNRASGRKHALVLTGGGANGAYQVGVMKALLEGHSPATGHRPIDPRIVTGTSVGAYNAAMMTSLSELGDAAALERLEQVWRHRIAEGLDGRGNGVYRLRVDPRTILDPRQVLAGSLGSFFRALSENATFWARLSLSTARSLLSSTGASGLRALPRIDIGSIVSVEPFLALIQETVDLEAIRTSTWSLTVATSHWNSGLLRFFSNADFVAPLGHRAILASAAIPGLFPRVDIEGEPYVDGGVAANAPIQPAMTAGAEIIHLVALDSRVTDVPLAENEDSLDIFHRLSSIGWSKSAARGSYYAYRMNQALEHLEGSATADPAYMKGFHDCFQIVAAHLHRFLPNYPDKSVTVHLHLPSRFLGGAGSWLDFSAARIDDLMELGYRDTQDHDCERAWCILPGQTPLWLREGPPLAFSHLRCGRHRRHGRHRRCGRHRRRLRAFVRRLLLRRPGFLRGFRGCLGDRVVVVDHTELKNIILTNIIHDCEQ